jgi:hypothetical protein
VKTILIDVVMSSSICVLGLVNHDDGYEIWNHDEAMGCFGLALAGRGEDDCPGEYEVCAFGGGTGFIQE